MNGSKWRYLLVPVDETNGNIPPAWNVGGVTAMEANRVLRSAWLRQLLTLANSISNVVFGPHGGRSQMRSLLLS
ncbi:hypothetical protein [Mesorhizobium sp.]|uniref:hypothetical protein n=1 Tax=Mesorhizobium sp. TaxID=1871066 RepID=UPI000FE4128C|nr:hypothetical protein [Mesorhizobium sp.]RWO02583.1 MAG: hypothetical protein EOS06_00110 [Mesorhizobium sp.]RWO82469.1 MAG: hypothetical protein EOS18_08685 [Mesorhizobium sp.]TIL43244.1 MAG: hypothetical protein E5Y86_23145 [Mesorhizobium sp.]TIL60841.1 MAG: hypothetical protein E5Y79_07165 [Mesorhizobium sp.]TIL84678.1 MAG: hypothetical protein E5Y73_32260 [Mesorhizobium sp.]